MPNEQANASPAAPPEVGYEKRDVNLWKILAGGIGGILLIVIMLVVLSDYFVMVREEQVYESVLQPRSTALRDLRAREIEILNSYQVIDSAAGRFRIPIDRAIELMAAENYEQRRGR